MRLSSIKIRETWKTFLIAAAISFLYATVLPKLGYDWWTDDNYSHGLLVPFVITFVIWLDFDAFRSSRQKSSFWLGIAIVTGSMVLLLVGTLASELFSQRLSFVLMLVGVVVYFFGREMIRRLFLPLLLLLLAIPIPQILFNKIAFPLQTWASEVAGWGIRLFGIAAVRYGNVIEIIPRSGTHAIGLEVVEACSGIRSLMTLVSLALVLGYFTSDRREMAAGSWKQLMSNQHSIRIVLLMLSAIPIALLTNAARVMITGLLTYSYGADAATGTWHEIAGSFVFLSALAALILVNRVLAKVRSGEARVSSLDIPALVTPKSRALVTSRQTIALCAVILVGGIFINWFQYRGEAHIDHRPLSEIPSRLGTWEQEGDDVRFDPESEKVLHATDYVMRNYTGTNSELNLYVGYYASQLSGATYHSPLNCLPGSGWEMKDHELVWIETPKGLRFEANQYVVQYGEHREILIYWFQGRGRTTPSEYAEKLYTTWDSIMKRRSDGAMIRIMSPVGEDEGLSQRSALDLSSQLADNLSPFLPN